MQALRLPFHIAPNAFAGGRRTRIVGVHIDKLAIRIAGSQHVLDGYIDSKSYTPQSGNSTQSRAAASGKRALLLL